MKNHDIPKTTTSQDSGESTDKKPEIHFALNNRLKKVGATLSIAALLATGIGLPKIKTDKVLRVGVDGNNPVLGVENADKHPQQQVQEQTIETQKQAAEKYAINFSESSEAGELIRPNMYANVSDTIARLQEDGYTITKISVEGHASDEDDTVNQQGERTAGLGHHSVKNEELAEKRANDFKDMVVGDMEYAERLAVQGITDGQVPPEGLQPMTKDEEAEAQKRLGELPEVEISKPVEDLLSKTEIHQIDKLAEQLGYQDRTAMIEDYNHGDGVSSEVKSTLDKLLAKDRKVVTKIVAVKPPENTKVIEVPIDIPIFIPTPLAVALPVVPPVIAVSEKVDAKKPDFKEELGSKSQVHASTSPVKQKQPRPFNYSQNYSGRQGSKGIRGGRSKGGDKA